MPPRLLGQVALAPRGTAATPMLPTGIAGCLTPPASPPALHSAAPHPWGVPCSVLLSSSPICASSSGEETPPHLTLQKRPMQPLSASRTPRLSERGKQAPAVLKGTGACWGLNPGLRLPLLHFRPVSCYVGPSWHHFAFWVSDLSGAWVVHKTRLVTGGPGQPHIARGLLCLQPE